jgi:hypothetical protein
MGEWIAIADWASCVQLQRPGYVFEIRNTDGQSLFTHCVVPLPAMPFDWRSPPVEFRLVEEAPPQRSTPIPPPAQP